MGLLSLGFALVWFLPARWAMPLLEGRLGGVRLQEVSGLLWDGHAGQVLSARGDHLGQMGWQLSRTALLGDNRLQVDLHGPRFAFQGRMAGRNAADARWTDVHMRADLDLLGTRALLPAGMPRGIVNIEASNLQLHGGWPLTMDAQIQWQDAFIRTPRQDNLSLGTMQLTLQGNNGVIEGRLQDSGQGPLRVDGRLQLSPLAWRFTAETAPRGASPALLRWLAGFGATDVDGVTHISYSGGLAAAISGGKR